MACLGVELDPIFVSEVEGSARSVPKAKPLHWIALKNAIAAAANVADVRQATYRGLHMSAGQDTAVS